MATTAEEQVPRLRRPLGGFARDDGDITTVIPTGGDLVNEFHH